MALRMMLIAGMVSGLSMCATTPAPEEPADTGQTGPDGLVIRNAPTESVESGALPAPGGESEAN